MIEQMRSEKHQRVGVKYPIQAVIPAVLMSALTVESLDSSLKL